MKTFTKVWIFIGFFLLLMALGFIIYDTTYLQKKVPKVYQIEYQFHTKDAVLVSFNCSYSAVLGDDPYQDKEMCIEFLSTEATHEICWDLYLVDYLQKKDEILYDIRQNLITKVIQRFPDIEFQVLNITMVFEL